MDKIIITDYKDKVVSLRYEKDLLVQIETLDNDKKCRVGNIYTGKVKNIVQNINSCFVEIENKQMCYFSLADGILPIFLNEKKDNTIKVGDEILVQVAKESLQQKAPLVRADLNFSGKYVVITYGKTDIGISNKICDDSERKRLKKILKPYQNDKYGFIVRTNAKDIKKEILVDEIEYLISIYNNVYSKSINTPVFKMVYKEQPSYVKEIRDSKNDIQVITDIDYIYDEITMYCKGVDNDKIDVSFYNDELCSLKALYNVNSLVENALNKKVWLKSGATIVIEPTEALVAIDVNTGKAIKGKGSNIEKTFLKINLEAAKEIARQIRLRNLTGIIIVDFIDLNNKKDKEYLVEEFRKILVKDPIKTTLIEMTKLNLVEITRKKIRKPLWLQFKE